MELIEEMKEAYEKDCDANAKKQGSTEKLKKLPMVEQKLRSAIISKKFLESNGQNILAEWLSRLPDKSELNVTFRTRMYNLLLDLKIPSYDAVNNLHAFVRKIYQQGTPPKWLVLFRIRKRQKPEESSAANPHEVGQVPRL